MRLSPHHGVRAYINQQINRSPVHNIGMGDLCFVVKQQRWETRRSKDLESNSSKVWHRKLDQIGECGVAICINTSFSRVALLAQSHKLA